MTTPPWLAYVTAFGAITTPLLVLALTGLGWKWRSRIERRFTLEDKLREDRIETYLRILEPYAILLMSEAAWKSNPRNKNKDKDQLAIEKILSVEYRQESFRLTLMGSDEVVRAHNNLFQFLYQGDEQPNPIKIMKLLGRFLLEIRKSIGSPETKLDELEMLEWFLTDARKYREGSYQTPRNPVAST